MTDGAAPVTKTRPFLKWAGNKYRIIDRVRNQLPPGKRLIEPFAGSGAVFLNTHYDHYLLTDTNPDLIHLFNFIKDEGDKFIRYARRLFTDNNNNEKEYYLKRDKLNHSNNLRQRAALFIYLNRHGYNGLCRYNASGGFNVPFGRYVRPYFPEKEMHKFHIKAQRAEFQIASFESAFSQAKTGDVIYCDPPYVPLSESASFTSYSAGGFSLEQQQQLAEMSKCTAKKGIPVLVSNHNTEFTRQVYKSANRLDEFYVQRFISCNGQKRNHAGEVLALYSHSK
jgi:DNA adenine methylase